MLKGVAAFAVLAGALAGPGLAQDGAARRLASELRVAAGDLARLATPDLPTPHRQGLIDRLAGSLGLLPWLLQRAGDAAGAAALERPQGADPAADPTPLAGLLAELSDRHPLDLAQRMKRRVSPNALAEAQAIHETYCAGCHDEAGDGDPELALPARDLFSMARDEPREEFLARLVSGIKGDESLAFANPMSDAQLLALLAFYAAR